MIRGEFIYKGCTMIAYIRTPYRFKEILASMEGKCLFCRKDIKFPISFVIHLEHPSLKGSKELYSALYSSPCPRTDLEINDFAQNSLREKWEF